MNIKVMVATHKQYAMPQECMYVPLHVGRAGKEDLGFQGDHTGDNISGKNANYCELTCLYWAWKNVEADALGLVHYRRYFCMDWRKKQILTEEAAQKLLGKFDIILPKKRRYFIETNYSQYIHAHHEEDLAATRRIIAERWPAYLAAYDRVMSRTSGHRFNMMIMKREYLEKYCEWLFDILFTLEQTLDISGYSAYDARVFGFVAERLLDVWLEVEQVCYGELPVRYMEKQNWLIKGSRFLARKFLK